MWEKEPGQTFISQDKEGYGDMLKQNQQQGGQNPEYAELRLKSICPAEYPGSDVIIKYL